MGRERKEGGSRTEFQWQQQQQHHCQRQRRRNEPNLGRRRRSTLAHAPVASVAARAGIAALGSSPRRHRHAVPRHAARLSSHGTGMAQTARGPA
ncbi:hypothetical protein TPAR_04027 [Tolypocladium paradoxum]|uniref:Uncharacterized protein n=1 Tax=Tolypocladium paradoxum TaxID=94208 RepID=A0A2S4L047_9HYPO|nr:hypothetical protein TPAR_04027 [Tolypocladium paradoxum]